MEQFGDELRIERERRQITLETVCAVTKISMRHLEALEAGNYFDLPGGVFRKGIVRSYLSTVGLEEQSWLERFDSILHSSESTERNEDGWEEFAENVRRNRSGKAGSHLDSRWIGVAAMIGALVALGLGVLKFVLHGRLSL